MRTTTTNGEVYLSILASRAVTGLAQLADHLDGWTPAIAADLSKGIAFCDSLSEQVNVPVPNAKTPEQLAKIMRRLTTEMSGMKASISVPQDEIRSKRQFLQLLVDHQKEPTLQEISEAINFFFSATSGYIVKEKRDEELF